MFAVKNFIEVVKASIEAKIDLIISGAGFSRDIFGICRKAKIPFVPIVSSLKLAKISERLGAAAIIVEGGSAGGHIGTKKDSWDIIKEITENIKIPVIGAGGIINKDDMHRMFKLGVNGVQVGSRFLASFESNITDTFRELIIKAKKEDIVTIISAVGLPANAIRTKFSEAVLKGVAPKPEKCDNCLKACTKKFCILDALRAALDGDLENGLFFAGKDAWRINEILSVKDIFKHFFD
jgi:NAD(P)H-dependent flavin oxidoreductase YrpB (nitropropane dioxygenase family)